MEKLVYNIDELAVALGFKSVGAVYKHVNRKNWDAIPPPVRLGARLVWPRDTVKMWLSAKNEATLHKKGIEKPLSTSSSQQKKRGRPRKTV